MSDSISHNGSVPAHRARVLAALDQHEQRLVRFAARLLRDESSARDVVQHAFLQLCRQSPEKMRSLNSDNAVARWLFSVARHRALDLLRERRRRPALNGEAFGDFLGGERDPAIAGEERELGEILLGLVDHLPDAQRESVLLWAEGWTSSEIGEITSRAPATVRVHLHTAFKTLRGHPAVRRLNESAAEALSKGG